MALKPTKPTVPPAPSRANPGIDFSDKADAFASFQAPFADYMDGIATFTDERADEALAAAIGGTLPDITDKAGQYIRVNNAGTAVEFGPLADQDNRIINGAFDHWQRGTSHSTNSYGSADRWFNGASGGMVAQSRQSHTAGHTFGANNPAFFLRQTVSGQTLSSHFAATLQRIEGVRTYAGQTVTILGWARRSSGSGNMAVEMEQGFGTGGSPSAAVSGVGVTMVTLSGTWQPFAVTVSVPSITGKTLGSNGDDFLAVNFWTSAGSNFNARTNSLGLQTIGVDLWGIHIRIGAHTTAACDAYRAPEVGPELARCQRYYQIGVARFDGQVNNTTAESVRIQFATTMRVAPTVTQTHISATNFGTTPGQVNVGADGFSSRRSATGTGAAAFVEVWTADAEL